MSEIEQAAEERQPTSEWVNVGPEERTVTALLGAMMVAWGARERHFLGTLAALGGAALLARSATGHCPGYAAMAPTTEQDRIAREQGWSTAVTARQSIVIDRPRDEIYRFWRDQANLPRFMQDLEHVEKLSEQSTRWTVLGPGGRRLHWVSTIVEDRPPELISWAAGNGADVRNAGWVRFHDVGHGMQTQVDAFMAYEPPAGKLGHAVASLLGRDPGHSMQRNLQQLKQILESERPAREATLAEAPVG